MIQSRVNTAHQEMQLCVRGRGAGQQLYIIVPLIEMHVHVYATSGTIHLLIYAPVNGAETNVRFVWGAAYTRREIQRRYTLRNYQCKDGVKPAIK